MRKPILIIGASARAAAEAAVRAGFTVFAIDQFGDKDLRQIADVRTLDHFPQQMVEVANTLPPAPVLLTGAMENHLPMVLEIARSRPLYGSQPTVLQAVRDPIEVQRALATAGLARIETTLDPPKHCQPSQWLQKPLRSSGGLGIGLLDDWDSAAEEKKVYYQPLLKGPSQSGLFLASPESVSLVGVTEQWIGTDWLHARPFGYAGSLGPLQLDASTQKSWHKIGRALTTRFGLKGLFGVDAVIQEGIIRPVEVNPRFTASAEIIDLAGDGQIVEKHVRACCGESPQIKPQSEMEKVHAKAIFFAPRCLVVPDELLMLPFSDSDEKTRIRLADIPHAGTRIERAHPVATLLAEGADANAVARALRRAAQCLEQKLTGETQEVVDSLTSPASYHSELGNQRRPAISG